jgi:DNA-binding beta-propeller fold protein YncE
MKRTAGLAALAVLTVAALAPATALSPQRAVAGSLAVTHASVPGGTKLWAARYRGQAKTNTPVAIAASPDGSMVFLTGPFRGSSGPIESATIAYDASTGAQLWAQVASGNTGTGTHELAVSPDGSAVFVTGWLGQGSPTSAFTTIAYSAATGAKLWARSYQGPGKVSVPEAVTVSPDGSRLFVTGSSSGSPAGTADFATVAYATVSGAVLWSRSYPPPATSTGASGAVAAGVSPDGTLVFVTGASPGSRPKSTNYTTIAYDTATGHTSWVARYRGRQDFGVASSLAVSPTGQAVFVTGYLHGHAGSLIFGTVAYQP